MRPTGFQSQAAPVLSADQSRLRFNPDYELVQLEELSTEQREPLEALQQDPTFYGILRSRFATGPSPKSVSRDTADLLFALKEPQQLPDRVVHDADAMLAVTQLVCDGILQVAGESGWLCGPAACHFDTTTPQEPPGVLAALSLRSLKHAAALRTGDTAELSGHLYRYNSLPLTPEWLRRLPDNTAVQEYLQIQSGAGVRWELDRAWTRVPPAAEQGAWMAWSSRTIAMPVDTTTYKLYLSPLPSHLRDAFRIWLAAITAGGAFHCKIGNDVRGLLRPDKMVAYFGDRAALEEAVQRIASELSGCPSQGVPFTSELDSGALMSWGSDPPSEEHVPIWLRRQSWRQWICNRLGAALAVAKHHPCDSMPAWRFALTRLQLEGVELANWVLHSPDGQPNTVTEVTAV
jgi:hypothetical protein